MKPGPGNKCLFYEEMAKLLEAGFDIRKAADAMDTSDLPSPQRVLLQALRSGLERGDTIADSFGKNSALVSDLEQNIISAGERSGKLGRSFQHLADYFAMVASARNEILKGLIYPVIILHMGVFVGTVPLAVMQGVKSSREISVSFLITLLIIYGVCVVLFFMGRYVMKMAPRNVRVDALIGRIPWIGKARQMMAMSRFCKVYHSCLLAGVSMLETVRVSTNAAQSGRILEAGERIGVIAKEGYALGPQFLKEAAFPREFSRSYASGEEAGTLDSDMGKWSARFQEKAESTLKSAAVMVPKILYFLVLMFIAWKIVGFFSGYYAELESLVE